MVEILNPEKFDPYSDHNCKNELPLGGRSLHPRREELPWGIVAKCSCGRMWETISYGWSYTEWVPARWWKRWYYACRTTRGSL